MSQKELCERIVNVHQLCVASGGDPSQGLFLSLDRCQLTVSMKRGKTNTDSMLTDTS